MKSLRFLFYSRGGQYPKGAPENVARFDDVFRTSLNGRLHWEYTGDFHYCLLPLLIFLGLAASPSRAEGLMELPEYSAQGAAAPEVTLASLFASERFWPYQATLIEPWPVGQRTIDAGLSGVLIRVEADGFARIDFGRDGLHCVPVAHTDLVHQANRVRRGETEKSAPNFLLAMGSRLIDSAAAKLQPFDLETAGRARFYLCVFAPVEGEALEKIAAALKSLPVRPDCLTVWFPFSQTADAIVRERLHALDWKVPFVYDHLAETYAASLLSDGCTPPAVLLVSDEGRLLFETAWTGSTAADLAAALENFK